MKRFVCLGKLVLCSVVLILVAAVSFAKFRTDLINYHNSDATWHTLLTVAAYRETPAHIHKFLPIVSLGAEDDKGIPWGATIPDAYGNHYYTSFSSAGFIAAYGFLQWFALPVSESGIYIFNSLLFGLSAVLLSLLLFDLFSDSVYRNTIVFLGALTYISMPEILHGMGCVYWHQSLMQVTLPIQLLAYRKREQSGLAKYVFYATCVLNPYIEWSGYVANGGIALADFFTNRKKDKRKALKSAGCICALTAVSFCLFCLHFLAVVDAGQFFSALKNRFFARNFTSAVSVFQVLYGYGTSFRYVWAELLFLIGLLCALSVITKVPVDGKDSVLWKNRALFFILLFMQLENLIMKQHAVAYAFDRMKMSFVLVLLICDISNLITSKIKRKSILFIVIVTILFGGGYNIKSYLSDTMRIWSAPFRAADISLANKIKPYRHNSLIGTKSVVRGFINMLYARGVYEGVSHPSALMRRAKEQGKDYVILLHRTPSVGEGWSMIALGECEIYHVEDGTSVLMYADQEEAAALEPAYRAARLSDKNWINGISNKQTTVLFYYSEALLQKILLSHAIVSGESSKTIRNVDWDKNWIRVEVDGGADVFSFPHACDFR